MNEALPHRVAREFEDFYETTVRGMLGLALTLTNANRSAAEDLVQQAYLLALCRWVHELSSLAHRQRVKWMRTCIAYTAANARRDARRFERYAPLLWEPDRSPASGPDVAALAALTADECWRGIREMSLLERVVSVLVWGDGYSGSQVAAILGEEESTVRGALKRARDKLLERVGPQLTFEPRYGSRNIGKDGGGSRR